MARVTYFDLEGAAQRIPIEPPADVPHWGREAKWLTVPDLLGADPAKPVARYDRTGLLWALQGEAVVELKAKTACISGSLTHRRWTTKPRSGPPRDQIVPHGSCYREGPSPGTGDSDGSPPLDSPRRR